MKSLRKYLPAFVIIFSSLLYTGCVDSPVAPKTEVITGKIYSEYSENFLVSIDEYPIVHTMRNTIFNLNKPEGPYNLVVSDFSFYWPESQYVIKYGGVTTNSPQIIMAFNPYGEYYYGLDQDYHIYIHSPYFKGSKAIFTKFVNDKKYHDNSTYIPRSDSIGVSLLTPAGEQNMSGRLYILVADVDSLIQYQIISYTNFGWIDLTLAPGRNPSIFLTPSDLNHDPAEFTVPVSSDFPVELEERLYISMGVPFKNGYKDIDISPLRFGKEFILPQLNIPSYKTKLTAQYTGIMQGIDYAYFEPGSPMHIAYDPTFTISSPPETGEINDNTLFQINDPDQGSVYEITFLRYTHSKYITTKKSFSFSEAKARGFEFEAGKEYKWCVRKFSGFGTVDEFLREPYVNNDKLDKIMVSTLRRFVYSP